MDKSIKQEIEETLGKITGTKWFADEDEYSWDLYGQYEQHPTFATPKIIKAPKKSKEYAEYWPNEHDGKLIVNAPTWIKLLLEENKMMLEFIEHIHQMAKNDVAARTGGQTVGLLKFNSLSYAQRLKRDTEKLLNGGELPNE